MERTRLRGAGLHECLGKNVLAAVLLQVIKPSCGVNHAANAFSNGQGGAAVHDVKNSPLIGLNDVDDAYAVDRAGVVWLASSSRVKRSAIKNDPMNADSGMYLGDDGFELEKG